MKYLIIGAGGTGGCIGAYMARAGRDVTLIARGEHLEHIKKDGLIIDSAIEGEYAVRIKASDMEHYNERPDVIFVCVKYYSLQEIIPFMQSVLKTDTVIIPVLNVYTTGEYLQQKFADNLVTDGCIYVASQIKSPGVIHMDGKILRVVFGVREKSEFSELLLEIKKDLSESGIEAVLSDNIRRDALMKFSYVSLAAACGLYYDADAGKMQKEGEIRDFFVQLIKEVEAIARAIGIEFGTDIVKTNLDILDSLCARASTSLQRDIYAGKKSEYDGLIKQVIIKAGEYGIDVPGYKKVHEKELRLRNN